MREEQQATNARLDVIETQRNSDMAKIRTSLNAMVENMRSLSQQANSNGSSPRQAPDPPHPPADNEEEDSDDDEDDDDEDMKDNPPTRPSTRSGRGRF